MIVVSVVGVSKSGKTTTIEYLTSKLTGEGYKVGSVKHIHHQDFSIDTEGTDTWRHAHSGAKVTVAVAPKETVIIKKTDGIPTDLNDIIKLFKDENLDVLFIEGLHSLTAKRKDIPKIVTAKNIRELTKTLEGTDPVLAITGVIAKKKTEIGKVNAPLIDLDKEGATLLELVKNQIELKNSSGR